MVVIFIAQITVLSPTPSVVNDASLAAILIADPALACLVVAFAVASLLVLESSRWIVVGPRFLARDAIIGVINLASAREIDPFRVTIAIARAFDKLGSTGGVLDRSAFELLGGGVLLNDIHNELLDLLFVKSLVGGCLVQSRDPVYHFKLEGLLVLMEDL